MNILIYIAIFIFTVIEETLRTLRIIVVSNGKKVLGSILQFFIALIWVIVTGTVIREIKEDPLKIVFYALGSLLGSYLGSTIEEKIALGYIELTTEVNKITAENIVQKLKNEKYNFKTIPGSKVDTKIIMITSPRKKSNNVIEIIRLFDKKSEIITEKIKLISHR